LQLSCFCLTGLLQSLQLLQSSCLRLLGFLLALLQGNCCSSVRFSLALLLLLQLDSGHSRHPLGFLQKLLLPKLLLKLRPLL
jgi:hypothetical protein